MFCFGLVCCFFFPNFFQLGRNFHMSTFFSKAAHIHKLFFSLGFPCVFVHTEKLLNYLITLFPFFASLFMQMSWLWLVGKHESGPHSCQDAWCHSGGVRSVSGGKQEECPSSPWRRHLQCRGSMEVAMGFINLPDKKGIISAVGEHLLGNAAAEDKKDWKGNRKESVILW